VYPAVITAVLNDRPFAALFDDLDHAVTMRRHFNLGLRLRQFLLWLDVRKHQMRDGVFVIDAEQTPVGVFGTGGQRLKADIVAIVAKLLRLVLGRLVHRIERRRVCGYWVTPSQQHIHGVTVGDMMRPVLDVRNFRKG